MGKLIGVRPIHDDAGNVVEIHVFDNGTYRYEPNYEPNYTLNKDKNSFYKIENGEVFFKHEPDAVWWATSNLTCKKFIHIIKSVVSDHIVEEILLK